MKKIVIISILVAIGISGFLAWINYNGIDNNNSNTSSQENQEMVQVSTDGVFTTLADPNDFVSVNGKIIPLKVSFGFKPELQELYSEIKMSNNEKTLVIIPIFTASAYMRNGFYDYYQGTCDQRCLTVKIVTNDELDYHSSANAVKILKLLGYDTISDIDVDKDPTILSKYKKIILLHNEYVTENEFTAITSHPNVIYLYPNALYAKISVNYENNSISLINGHGYPEKNIDNGFQWKFDNTHPYESDTECLELKFNEIENGHMLNCYPEQKIWKDEKLLKTIKEF